VLEEADKPFQGGVRPVRCLTREARLDHLPVFVRAGAIIPKQALAQSTARAPKGPLELHVYPGAEGARGELYWDDGESFAYQHGDFARRRFRWDGALTTEASEGDCPLPWSGVAVVAHGGKITEPEWGGRPEVC
jgi:alpha-glucosidase